MDEGIVYLEITARGARPRLRLPGKPAPNVIAFTQPRPLIANPYAATG